MNLKIRFDIQESRILFKGGSRQFLGSENNSVYIIVSMYDEKVLIGFFQKQFSIVQFFKYEQEDLLFDFVVSLVFLIVNKEGIAGIMVSGKLGVIRERVVFLERIELFFVYNFVDNLVSIIMQSVMEEVVILEKFVERENIMFIEESKLLFRRFSLKRSQLLTVRKKSDLSFIFFLGREFRIIILGVRFMVEKIELLKLGIELIRSFLNISRKSVLNFRYEFYGVFIIISIFDFFF